MLKMFLEEIKKYKEKCDFFFKGNEGREYLSSFGLDEVMSPYLDALLRHSEGGKRIRAYLVYLAYTLYKGCEDAYRVFLPSLSYELFQTGILAHDDIIDNSDYRRFKPSMHMDLGGGHDGVSKSICVGDMGIVSALDIIAKSDFSPDVKLSAISHQSKVFASTIAGELKDIEFETESQVNEDDILSMYRLKTAQYTVSGPLVLGAILAGADEGQISALSEFGDCVGISFQIRDDILGVFGETETLGKSNTSDMCEGKKTILTSRFFKCASDEDKKKFNEVYGREESGNAELEKVREMFVKNGCYDYADSLCREYAERAKKALSKLDISRESAELLEGLLEYMTSRNY